jgi:hypothetical protein
MQIVKW